MYMLGCYKRTKNTCNRTRRKASTISMIQTLKFEMLSSGKHYNMTELRRMKRQFVQLYAKIAYMNSNAVKQKQQNA
jgi:tRNA uridine 5-carbamoylmethylation protein Kti12